MLWFKYLKAATIYVSSLGSIGKIIKIIRPVTVIWVWISTSQLACEFLMTLSFRLSVKKYSSILIKEIITSVYNYYYLK
jgi:hypothetical protein